MGKVLTIGELMMRLTPKYKGRLNNANEMNVYYGGAEANVAMALSNFGHVARLLSVIPATDIGDAAISHLRGAGVDTSMVFREGNRLGIYYYEEGHSVKQAKVIYDRNNSSIHRIVEINLDWAQVYKDVDVLHLTGITPALSKQLREFIIVVLKKAKEFRVRISFDFNFRSKLWTKAEARKAFLDILPFVDICFAGYKDFIYLFEEDGPQQFDENHLARFYDKYSQQFDIGVFASTDRKVMTAHQNKIRGYFYQNNKLNSTESYSIDIIERVGGGDAFAAGILHGILSNMNPSDIVRFGTASGVLKHMVYGDYNQFSSYEIHEFLNNRNREISR